MDLEGINFLALDTFSNCTSVCASYEIRLSVVAVMNILNNACK